MPTDVDSCAQTQPGVERYVQQSFTHFKICERIDSPDCPNKHIPTSRVGSKKSRTSTTVRKGLGLSCSHRPELLWLVTFAAAALAFTRARENNRSGTGPDNQSCAHPVFGSIEGRTVSSVSPRIFVHVKSPGGVSNLEFQIMMCTW